MFCESVGLNILNRKNPLNISSKYCKCSMCEYINRLKKDILKETCKKKYMYIYIVTHNISDCEHIRIAYSSQKEVLTVTRV